MTPNVLGLLKHVKVPLKDQINNISAFHIKMWVTFMHLANYDGIFSILHNILKIIASEIL